MATKQEVAKAREASLAMLDGAAKDYVEPMGQDDMSIPFISVLQALSPQCDRGKPEFIKEAEPSMLFNSVTRALYPTRNDDDQPIPGMTVIDLYYKASFIEWITRAQGGGFVAEYDVAEGNEIVTARDNDNLDIILEGSKLGTPGNQLAYTHTHFAFVVGKGALEPAVISMAATQVKPSKDWNALINNLRLPNGNKAPRFYGVWDVTTRRRTNDKGSWYVFDFSVAANLMEVADKYELDVDETIKACMEFVDGIKAGQHTVDRAKDDNPTVSDTKAGADGDDVPF